MYKAAEDRGEDPGELGMLSQMLVSRASGRGEQPLMAEVGLEVCLSPRAGACHETPAGSLPDRGHVLCGFLMSLGSLVNLEPSVGRWQELFVYLPTSKRIASWVGRTQLLGAEHWGVPKAAPRSESRRSLPGTAVQIMGALPRGPRPTPQAG